MYLFVKRLCDVVLSLIAIVCLSWLLVPIMIILLCTGEHYIFYKQQRVGKGGKMFGVLKFATMLKNSPNIGSGLITTRDDPRVLPFGKFLRITKLNELPQLFNILLGTMSIIGPRPLAKKGFEEYSKEQQNIVIKMAPGLSGIGSVIFRDEEGFISQAKDPIGFSCSVILPHKGRLEEWYFNHRSLWVDFLIIFLTVWVIVFPKSNAPYKFFKDLPQIDLEKEVDNFNKNNNLDV